MQKTNFKSGQNPSLNTSINDNELDSTSCDTVRVPSTIINLKQLPDVSDVIAEMVNHGPHKESFKRIYGVGNDAEVSHNKKAFECALNFYHRSKTVKEQEDKELFSKKIIKEHVETSNIAEEASMKAQEAIVLCQKTIEETRAMIASYYQAIADFDSHMLLIRGREIRRIILEGTDEEKAQAKVNNYFENVEGKPKSKLHQIYIMNAKLKKAREEQVNASFLRECQTPTSV